MTLSASQKQKPATVMILDAAKALPSADLSTTVYVALADKRDMKAVDLEWLGNKLCQLAWEMQRQS
jgi:hypothetical protein